MSLSEKARTMSWISHEAESLRKAYMNPNDRQKELSTLWVLFSEAQQEIGKLNTELCDKDREILDGMTREENYKKEREELKQKLRQILDDFGDISEYDNDDVIELHKSLLELSK